MLFAEILQRLQTFKVSVGGIRLSLNRDRVKSSRNGLIKWYILSNILMKAFILTFLSQFLLHLNQYLPCWFFN